MIVKELIAKLGLEMDEGAFAGAERALAGLHRGYLAFGGAAVAALGAVALEFAHATAEAADQVRKLAQKTGVDSIALQEFAYAADLADVSTETLAQGMAHLAKTGVKDVQGEMLRLAEQFQSMPDDGDKVRLAMEKFGRSGKELIPLLNGGREEMAKLAKEAHELGLVFSKEDQKASEEFNDELKRLQKTFTGFRNRIGLMLIRPLRDGVTAFQQWVHAMDAAHPGAFEASVKALGLTMGLVGALAVGAALKTAAAWLLAAAPFVFVVAGAVLAALALEDFYGFLQGKESVIGHFSEYVKKEFGSWEGFFFTLLKWLGTLFDEFWDGIKARAADTVDIIKGLWEMLKISPRAGMEAARTIGAAVLPGFAPIKGGVDMLFGGGASPSDSAGSGVNVPKTPVVSAPQFRADFVINTTPGMSPKEVAEQVKFVQDDWWHGKMREAAAGAE